MKPQGDEVALAESEPRVLIVETSGRSGWVAIAESSRIQDIFHLDEARRHARDLVPGVGELLAKRGWRPKDIQAVVVSLGPGSYTGLRVGIMSAKAFSYATGSKLIGIETFGAIATQAPGEATVLDVIGDAQQDKVYVQSFARISASDRATASSSLTIKPVAEWLQALEKDRWITGPGAKLHQGHLQDYRYCDDPIVCFPQPETLLRIGLERHQEGKWDDIWKIEPIYLRPSSAEEKWDQKR
jgi:tRNA threonylcarbamoyladenosine biosynthesis protein TsaB